MNIEHMVQLFIEDVLKSNLMPIGEMVYLFPAKGIISHALFWVSSCIWEPTVQLQNYPTINAKA